MNREDWSLSSLLLKTSLQLTSEHPGCREQSQTKSDPEDSWREASPPELGLRSFFLSGMLIAFKANLLCAVCAHVHSEPLLSLRTMRAHEPSVCTDPSCLAEKNHHDTRLGKSELDKMWR